VQWAALIAWLATALGGLTLFVLWIRHGGLRQVEGIPARRLLSHLAIAIVGLCLWVAYLVSDKTELAWAAVVLLVAVALLGLWMFMTSSRGRTTTTRTSSPAEAMFPAPVVIGHGILGLTTLILVFLAAAGIGV